MKLKISKEIKKYSDDLDNKLKDIVNSTLLFTYEELVAKAPADTHYYISQMQVDNAEKKKKNIIYGRVFNDIVVTSKAGDIYCLGELLENGTRPHAIPNAFGKGYYYGYVDENGKYHKGTLDKDWHPGFRPIPHWQPAYEKAIIHMDRLLKERL